MEENARLKHQAEVIFSFSQKIAIFVQPVVYDFSSLSIRTALVSNP